VDSTEIEIALKRRYTVDKDPIGSGGFGTVFRAEDVVLKRPVAIKILKPGLGKLRIEQEAKILAQIDAPNVVTIFDYALLEGDTPCIIMKWVAGTDLKKKTDQQGPIEESTAVVWMQQICRAMIAVSKEKIVHRDIKPENILIDTDGNVLLTDFGIALDSEEPLGITRKVGALGSVYYMSPEQAIDSHSVDFRSDMYSLGATFYYALTGSPPFSGTSEYTIVHKHITEPLVWPGTAQGRLSEAMREVLERCMAKKPGDRFLSFEQLLDVLQTMGSRVSPWQANARPNLAPLFEKFSNSIAAYLADGNRINSAHRYTLKNGRTITILHGDLSQQKADAIVSSDDGNITMSGGISGALRHWGGESIYEETQKYVPVKAGRAVVTSAGKLKARFVFHGITIDFSNALLPSRDLINQIMDSCFYHADTLEIEKIAFPLLGTGLGGFSREICLDTMFRCLAARLSSGTSPIREATIVLFTGNAR
jgi:serine/threonine protein kinase